MFGDDAEIPFKLVAAHAEKALPITRPLPCYCYRVSGHLQSTMVPRFADLILHWTAQIYRVKPQRSMLVFVSSTFRLVKASSMDTSSVLHLL
jgi:hypothetical protein